jgi:Kef-type K+ transport system membrane component KefB
MFFVGVTLNLDHLHKRRAATLLTSLGSIVVPFGSGFILAFFVYHRLVGPGVSLTAFSLFFGVCMAITAFPVLARILQETDIIKTPLGAIAIACAAVDDICAWLILAGILGFLRGSARHWPMWQTGATLGAYFLVMLVFRRVFMWLTEGKEEKHPSRGLSMALLVAIGSSVATEWMGIHALFGAFFAGAVMPKKPHFVESVRQAVEPFATAIFLPIFFALTGLRTHLNLIMGRETWIYTPLIVFIAVAGKWLGGMLAARLTGMPKPEACALGILMNARGLTELVILNIGFEMGLLPPAVFSMMVVMALVTTVMTVPLLRRTYLATVSPAVILSPEPKLSTYGKA